MEELALSHVINAEGEKIQYVLGSLKDAKRHDATVEDALAVNSSATKMLETIIKYELLLKNKLDRALDAYKKHDSDECE